MFLMIGLGERAGSGMARIQQGWAQTGGGLRLVDSFEPFDQTRLEMDFAKTLGETPGKALGETLGETRGKTPGEILAALKSNPEAVIPEIAAHLGKSRSAIERAIRKLKSEGRLTRIGANKGGRWVVIDQDELP
jgi:predicted HTH transcriptional regulator